MAVRAGIGKTASVRLREFLSRPDVREDRARLLARRLGLAVADRLTPRLLERSHTFRLTNGLLVTVPLADSVGRDLFIHGTFEWATLRSWEAAIPAGGTAVDVGAHVGTFTLTAARKVGPTGRVVSFEPHPLTREQLEHNIRQNNLQDRVTVLPYALLDHDDEMPLGTPTASNSGMSRLGVGNVMVPCRRLDDVLMELGCAPPVAMKIDVEGFEDAVLAGAPMVLGKMSTVIMEVNGEDAVARLRVLGFDLRTPGGEPFIDEATHQKAGESVNVVARRPR
jgi:FkbM family methyltransferase